MRELGPVKEPEDEKAPKKKPVKGGFLASWMRRENSGEPDARLDEQDLVDPEQDALFNDGFSKRWHKLFSGTMPVDDAAAAKPVDDTTAGVRPVNDTAATTATTDDTSADQQVAKEERAASDDKPGDTETAETASLMDEAREQVRKAAKSAEELKGEVEVQHDADHLSDKEITAAVPAKKTADKEPESAVKQKHHEDFDVFSSTGDSDEPKTDTAPAEELDFEDMESTPAGTGEPLPPLKDSADRAAINVFPAKELIPRVDPSEFAHQTDVEDNVEAPGAPTKGYRGLLIVDHPDRTTPKLSAPPSLPPEPEAFLPEIAHTTPTAELTPTGAGLPSKSPAYILPSKDPAKWPNPAKSRPVVGGKLNRNVQAMIDRPASSEISALVDKIAAYNRENEQYKAVSDAAAEFAQPNATAQTSEPQVAATSPQNITPKTSTVPEGASSVGSIIKDSPLAEKAKTREPAEKLAVSEQPAHAEATEMLDMPREERTPSTSLQPAITPPTEPATVPPSVSARPAPAPLYNPPTIQEFPAQPSMQLPILTRPDRYRVAMQRGILSGLAVSGAIMAAYLFG